VQLADGSSWHTLLTPQQPETTLHLSAPAPAALPAFLVVGVQHILTGVDHLVFILGLFLIVENRRALLKTVTAFTVAHSLTLVAATLGYARAPATFINSAIALSILFLAAEIVRRWRGGTSLSIERPWLVAFVFGLLHGFGFASGLSALGLPSHDTAAALLLFNLGVEIGQLAFVALLLWLAHAFRVLMIRWPRTLELLPGYSVGSLGAFWTIQRIVMLFGGPG
jgi:hydrogenase/urease accessory protein HupE